MRSSRMRTVPWLTVSCSLPPPPPPRVGRPGGSARPFPLNADPPDADFPGGRPPGHVTCDACWEATPPTPGMTDACENIALPQTSFGNK